MPRKLRELVAELEKAGFRSLNAGKGSHRKFIHEKLGGFVLISGQDGDDARHYQEQHVRRALQKVQS